MGAEADPELGPPLPRTWGARSPDPEVRHGGTATMTTQPRVLIVIQHQHRELYDLLRESLKDHAPVAVMYERRVRERRRGSDGPRSDRRQTDRRQRRPTALIYDGVRVLMEGKGSRAPDSARPPARRLDPTVATKACPECGVDLEFEMPRFPQPPGLIEAEPIHGSGFGPATQHYVEIQAFTASGRPLLVHRTQARARQRV
jgi:hypothetical protein